MKPSLRHRFSALRIAIACVAVLICVSSIAQRRPPTGSAPAGGLDGMTTGGAGRMADGVPPLAGREFDRGLASPGLPMERILLLLRSGQAQSDALETYLAELQDGQSPNYHRWLTPAQFGDRFGASADDIATVKAWLEGHGFAIGQVAQGRQWIAFSGNVSQVEAAFDTEIHSYVVDGQQHYSNATSIRLPPALASLTAGVVSLDDFGGTDDFDRTAESSIKGDAAGGSAPALTPAEFASLYDLKPLYDAGINGRGQSIAVIVRGNADSGQAAWARAIAPGSKIQVIAFPSTHATDGADLSMAHAVDQASARVLSSSPLRCDMDMGAIQKLFYAAALRQGAAEGITSVFAAPRLASCHADALKDGAAFHRTEVTGTAKWLQLAIGEDAQRPLIPEQARSKGSRHQLDEPPMGEPRASAAAVAGILALVNQYTGSALGDVNPRLAELADDPGVFHEHEGAASSAQAAQGSFDAYQLAKKWDAATGTATIAVTASSTTPVYGSNFTATATLASTSTPAPTGTVQFTVDGAAQGTATITTSGGAPTATLSFYTPIVGTHNLDAVYSGDANYAAATAPIVSIVVSHGASVTAIAAEPAVLTGSTPEVFTATVSDKVTTDAPGKFTGNVQFYDGTIPLATPVLLEGNVAVSSPVTLDATVNHAITAVYYGDGNWNGSVSPQITLSAGVGASNTVLTVSSPVALVGGVVTFTASVTGTTTAAGVLPTGKVTFLDGATPIGQSALVDNLGVPTVVFFTANLAAGSHQLTAAYQGDLNFAASTSAVVDLSVQGYTIVPSATGLKLNRGQSGGIIYTLSSAGGLAAAVGFGCAPPAAAEMTCAFTPASLSVSGQSVLTVNTTAPSSASAALRQTPLLRWLSGGVVSLALLLVPPFRARGRRPFQRSFRRSFQGMAGLAILACLAGATIGCGSGGKSVAPPTDPGTPLGVQTLTITTAVTLNGVTTTQHSYISVNVQ